MCFRICVVRKGVLPEISTQIHGKYLFEPLCTLILTEIQQKRDFEDICDFSTEVYLRLQVVVYTIWTYPYEKNSSDFYVFLKAPNRLNFDFPIN